MTAAWGVFGDGTGQQGSKMLQQQQQQYLLALLLVLSLAAAAAAAVRVPLSNVSVVLGHHQTDGVHRRYVLQIRDK